jgi:hypothetical protein
LHRLNAVGVHADEICVLSAEGQQTGRYWYRSSSTRRRRNRHLTPHGFESRTRGRGTSARAARRFRRWPAPKAVQAWSSPHTSRRVRMWRRWPQRHGRSTRRSTAARCFRQTQLLLPVPNVGQSFYRRIARPRLRLTDAHTPSRSGERGPQMARCM